MKLKHVLKITKKEFTNHHNRYLCFDYKTAHHWKINYLKHTSKLLKRVYWRSTVIIVSLREPFNTT